MTAPEELAPCPFCGGSNVQTFGPYGWDRQWCISHSCQAFYGGAQEMAGGFPTEAAAIAAWNRRVSAPKQVTEEMVAKGWRAWDLKKLEGYSTPEAMRAALAAALSPKETT